MATLTKRLRGMSNILRRPRLASQFYKEMSLKMKTFKEAATEIVNAYNLEDEDACMLSLTSGSVTQMTTKVGNETR